MMLLFRKWSETKTYFGFAAVFVEATYKYGDLVDFGYSYKVSHEQRDRIHKHVHI